MACPDYERDRDTSFDCASSEHDFDALVARTHLIVRQANKIVAVISSS